MSKETLTWIGYLVTVALFIGAAILVASEGVQEYLQSYLTGPFLGALMYMLLQVLAVVLAPFSALALVPVASALFGPALTALYSIISWAFGAVIAFLLARYVGRPLLEKFVSFKSIDRYEKKIHKDTKFLSLVLLRMIIPVDILSYATGFISTISFTRYTVATIIGITPFAFVFAYGGEAIIRGNVALLVSLTGVSFVFIALVYYLYRKIT